MRGQYHWYADPKHNKTPALLGPDHYERYFWKDVEPTDDQFVTTGIDDGIARATAAGGVYAFRVMALCAGCGEALPPQVRTASRTWTATIPNSTTTARIPDWNSEQFLAEWEELMRHLGAKYANNPRLGHVEVGGYGNLGGMA